MLLRACERRDARTHQLAAEWRSWSSSSLPCDKPCCDIRSADGVSNPNHPYLSRLATGSASDAASPRKGGCSHLITARGLSGSVLRGVWAASPVGRRGSRCARLNAVWPPFVVLRTAAAPGDSQRHCQPSSTFTPLSTTVHCSCTPSCKHWLVTLVTSTCTGGSF